MEAAADPAPAAPRRPPAPGELEHVRQFVNSADLETGEDDLGDVGALRHWFVSRGLMGPGEELGEEDLARAVAVREALRNLLEAHHGEVPDPRDLELLNAAAAAAPVRVVLDAEGAATLSAAAHGLEAGLSRLFAIIECASWEGTWTRLKVCPEETCRAAFYDHSRNRSGTWCNMAVCGNRNKARAFRRRRAGASQDAAS
jgi:predicted RNA-binding Zn ribbon-like protein